MKMTMEYQQIDRNGKMSLNTSHFKVNQCRLIFLFSHFFFSLEEHVVQRFSPPPPLSTSDNLFDTYDIAAEPITPSASSTKIDIPENYSPTTSCVFTVQKAAISIDNEDTTQTIIMNHLHSVKSLKKFFETKMIIQRANPLPVVQPEQKIERITNDQKEMMDQVLDSLKRKTNRSSGRCSTMTNSSYDCNLAVQRQYSRRFRSSSTSNNSFGVTNNIITQINPSGSNKRALSYDRQQQYQTSDHFLDQQRTTFESDDDDNISESSMLWQARTKLNEFVSRTRKSHQQQQSPYYSACLETGTPTEDLYTFDDNESVTAETRF